MPVNPLAIVLAALSAFGIGGLWYSVLFARRWQAASGVTDAQLAGGRLRVFGGAFLFALVMAASLAAFIGRTGFLFGTLAGFLAGATFVSAAFGIVYLFERRPLAHYFINAGYSILAFTAMGAILGAMQA
jgi:Protein of unknown function (DUF1761)